MHEVVGREVVRGSITRDRWQVTVTLVAADRVPVGVASPLGLAVRWREDGRAAAPPSDAHGVQLELRKRTASAVGELRFDAAGGDRTKRFAADTTELLTLFGVAASAGGADDVLLVVSIDGEERAQIPLAVGPPAFAIAIEAAGGGPAPSFLVPGSRVRVQATVSPAGAGAHRWVSLDPTALVVVGSATAAQVELEASGAPALPRIVCALFTPTGGRQAMAAATFAPGVRFAGEIEDRSAAPNLARADTRHVPLAAGRTFQVLDGATVVATGTIGASGAFDVQLAPGRTYELRIPGFEGLA